MTVSAHGVLKKFKQSDKANIMAPFQQIPLDAKILSGTPPEVIELILSLLERIRVLEARVEELEAKLNQNSSNSNKPPSSDPPFIKRPEAAKKPRKRKRMRQQCLRPTELVELHPDRCACGCGVVAESELYYIHQVVELPKISVISFCTGAVAAPANVPRASHSRG